jgi:hypothetical protein
MNSLSRRLKRLEAMIVDDPVIILVRDQSGNEAEIKITEFESRWKEQGLVFVRIVSGYDPTGHDIDVILNSWNEIANMEEMK